MRLRLELLPFAALTIFNASAQQSTVTIPILNSSFETTILGCEPGQYCDNGTVPSWLPTGFAGTLKPGPTQYLGGVVPDGVNVAFLGEPPTSTGSISQTLPANLQANTTYTLSFFVGHRLDEVFTGYLAVLQAGGVTLASSGIGLLPAAGTFLEDVVIHKTDAHPLQLGQRLTISIQSLGTGQVDVDHITLTSVDESALS